MDLVVFIEHMETEENHILQELQLDGMKMVNNFLNH